MRCIFVFVEFRFDFIDRVESFDIFHVGIYRCKLGLSFKILVNFLKLSLDFTLFISLICSFFIIWVPNLNLVILVELLLFFIGFRKVEIRKLVNKLITLAIEFL